MTRKQLLYIVLIIGITGFVGYNYIYQEHRDVEAEQADFNISANAISLAFKENSTQAEEKYLNKIIEVEGIVTENDKHSITLDDLVFCQFSKSFITSIENNTKLKIKGRLIGYDDLLEQVKLDQCIINN